MPRYWWFASFAIVAACTTSNPDVCCVTEEQCAALGVSELRPCKPGQACKLSLCVAAECETSADCTAPEAPVCVLDLCVASCQSDDHCAGSPGTPYCDTDGACVGCLSDVQCPSSQPFCDVEDRRCRGCERDDECASGVCLELDGRCAEESEVVFVSAAGEDTGECRKGASCKTLQYGLARVHVPERTVVHIEGGNLQLGADVELTTGIYLDGTNTTIHGDGTGPYLRVSGFGNPVTLSNVVLRTSLGPAVVVGMNRTVRLYNVEVSSAETSGGTIVAVKSHFPASSESSALHCASGTLTVDRCRFDDSQVGASNCQLSIRSSVFDASRGPVFGATGGKIEIENNLIIQSYELADTAILGNASPGSTVRFNTFVNTSAVVSDGVALYCDDTLDVTSNIFAYGSMHPHGTSSCSSVYSLYDTAALPEQSAGEGNKVADRAGFFVDRSARDFHLSANSPAKEMAEPGLAVTTDLEGKPRPNPAGSRPDVGALEAR